MCDIIFGWGSQSVRGGGVILNNLGRSGRDPTESMCDIIFGLGQLECDSGRGGGIFAHTKMRDVTCERPHICLLSEIISRNEAFEITFQLETRVMLETDEGDVIKSNQIKSNLFSFQPAYIHSEKRKRSRKPKLILRTNCNSDLIVNIQIQLNQ